MDAAVAASALLSVLEPYNTGPGGDCFLLVWWEEEKKLYGLNGSGRAPRRATLEAYRERGFQEVPYHGIFSVTVPGAVDAWCCALDRFGRLGLARVLEPAIARAEEGVPVGEVVAYEWGLIVASGLLRQAEARRVFAPEGRAPSPGECVRFPELARTFRRLAEGGRDEFYEGELARELVAFSRAEGGLLDEEDLRSHRSSWVEPISTTYRGYRLFEIPPNGQGIAALLGLNILENFDVDPASPDGIHYRIEAVKLAYADRGRYVADPEHAPVPVDELLSKDYAQGRAALVHPARALPGASPGRVATGGDTVCLVVADASGNVVSLLSSLYGPFGSGLVVPGTGVALQNRGRGFVLDPAHPNCLAPGKRPFHTIIPAMLFDGERPLVAFGVMGGDMQAQAHVQVVSNLVDGGWNVQEALDEPRFHYLEANRVALEDSFEEATKRDLARRGHRVEPEDAALLRGGFGGGQGVMVHPRTRVYWGGADRRKDGLALGS